MKKLLVLVFGLALVLVLQPAQDVEAAVDGNQVAICHFSGHGGDFVITGRGYGCLNSGGNVIVVGIKACEKGHDANNPDRGGLCTDDNLPRCEVCEAGGPGGDNSPAKDEH